VKHTEYPSYTSGVLSDSELRWFWIAWLESSGNISCGRGVEPGEEVIGSYVDDSPFPVNYMSVGSYGIHGSYFVIPSQLYLTSGT